MKKKLMLQIGSIVLAVLIIFFTSFMIGSKGGKYPLFFLNHRTVSKVVLKRIPETENNPSFELSNYRKFEIIGAFSECKLKLIPFDSPLFWGDRNRYIIYLKPFGFITVSTPRLYNEASNVIAINGIVFKIEREW